MPEPASVAFNPATDFKPNDMLFGYEIDRASGIIRAFHSEARDALGIKEYVPLSLETLDNDRVLYLHNAQDTCYSQDVFRLRTVAVYFRMPVLSARIYREAEASLYHGLSVMDEEDKHRPNPNLDDEERQAWHLYLDPQGEDESLLLSPKNTVIAIVQETTNQKEG